MFLLKAVKFHMYATLIFGFLWNWFLLLMCLGEHLTENAWQRCLWDWYSHARDGQKWDVRVKGHPHGAHQTATWSHRQLPQHLLQTTAENQIHLQHGYCSERDFDGSQVSQWPMSEMTYVWQTKRGRESSSAYVY